MNILILSTLKRNVAADVTASRSRIIYALSHGLAAKGHTVSLLGTGDSTVEGVAIIPVIEKGWVDLPVVENPFYRDIGTLTALAARAQEIAPQFDIIHNHTYPELVNLLVASALQTPMVTTLHQQATAEYDEALSQFSHANLVGLSQAHKALFHKAHIGWVVYNGIDEKLYAYEEKKDSYLLWLGRLSKAKDKEGKYVDPKGVKWAIQLAQETDSRLILAGAVEDKAFYEQEVKPHLNEKIVWHGDVSAEQNLTREEVVKLMQKAKAFLMTVNWEEPFGLVMAEAMSCGTPVIGFRKGAVPEVVEDGVTGFVVDPSAGLEGLKDALEKLPQIQPADCRKRVEDHFTIDRMVSSYEKIYDALVSH